MYMYNRVPINSDHLLHMATGNKPNISYRFENVLKYRYGILKIRISKYRNFDIYSNIGLKWCLWSEDYIILIIFSYDRGIQSNQIRHLPI